MGESEKSVAQAVAAADARWERHKAREYDRIRQGLPTDLERWIETGVAHDYE